MPPIKLSRVGPDSGGNYYFEDRAEGVVIEQDDEGQWDAWVDERHLGAYPSKAQATDAAQDYINKG